MLQIFMTLTKMISKPTREDADNKASFFFSKIENCKLYNEGLPYQKLEVIKMDIGSFLIGVGLTMATIGLYLNLSGYKEKMNEVNDKLTTLENTLIKQEQSKED